MKTRSPAMKTMAILTRSALLTGLCLPWLAAAQGTAGGSSAGLPVVQAGEQGLTVNAFASMLVSSDELVRAQLLEAAIAEQSVRGAKAVYEPFFTTKQKSLGLGLTNAQKSIINHKGILHFESKENLGTKFVIKLPLTNQTQLWENFDV